MRIQLLAFLCCAFFTNLAAGQSTAGSGTSSRPQTPPRVGVATIKPSDPDNGNRFYRVQGSHFLAQNQTIGNLVEIAYGLHREQVIGGPPWMRLDRFDLEAIPDPEGTYSYKDWNVMLQQILADRFQLACHHETRELPAFVLTQAKGGPKLPASKTAAHAKPNIDVKRADGININVIATHAAMSDFVTTLKEVIVGRPVIDQTGIEGHYDFTLRFASDHNDTNSNPQSDATTPLPELFTAIQEQLGLKLVPTKAPVDVLVIDDVKHPSQN